LKRLSILLVIAALMVAVTGCTTPAEEEEEEGPQYDLSVTSSAGGSVTTPGEAGPYTYAEGEMVDLVAVADGGYQFINWTGDVSTIADVNAASTTITMNRDCSVAANFAGTIRDWYDLDAVRNDLDGSYVLMNDLDSTTAGYAELASQTANGGKAWQPIGGLSVEAPYWYHVHPFDPFTGTFDGRRHEIRDLFIGRPDEDGVGVFGCVNTWGVVKNLGVMNAEVNGGSYVGGLLGGNWGTVSDCYLTGSIIGDEHTGGLVGGSWGPVRDCHTTGSVIGGQHTGGLVGGNNGAVSDCYSRSNVIDSGDVNEGGVGGLAGGNWGAVRNSYATGNVTGDLEAGGLVGFHAGGTVDDSYSTGKVTGVTRVGGLVGANCRDGSVTRSYSTGRVSGDNDVGGLVGYSDAAVTSSFWDMQTSRQSASAGGIGKTTAEMKSVATFSDAGWSMFAVANPDARNSSYVWNIVDGQTYPFLSWQPVS
jgi:hypothetical protein